MPLLRDLSSRQQSRTLLALKAKLHLYT